MTTRNIRAPRGAQLNCKGWHQEAALRCLMNNLDPDVAETPEELIVYGGAGKAARNWASFDAIVRELQELENDETLLVQSGKPVGSLSHARICAASFDRQFKSRRRLGQLGTLSRTRTQGPDDVRPDDGRQLDLHRHAGHRAGNI